MSMEREYKVSEKKLTQDKGLSGFILKRAALVLLDALIMNGSYYLALLIRFYFGGSFRTEKVRRAIPPCFPEILAMVYSAGYSDLCPVGTV